MVRFLINRPIAVTMTFIAFLVLGLVASAWLPVSLMPDVDIPKITVHISSPDTPARELENTVVRTFRRQLMQVQHLTDINSETRDGSAVITIDFKYGTDIDYAFVEVNEKVDRAMGSLPKNTDRPRVIKASATDIPVFSLNLTLKTARSRLTVKQHCTNTEQPEITSARSGTTLDQNKILYPVSRQFTELSYFASQVICKRVEQLPEVAIADISGQVFSELLIIPDLMKMYSLGITTMDIEKAINSNNISLGSLVIRDGQYQYNVKFENVLLSKQDIENIYIKNNSRLLQIRDIASIIEHPGKIRGKVISDGKDAVTMAIIKQADARVEDLRKNLYSLVENFREDYPDVDFTITRDQTALLDYSIRNLKQSLMIGGFLAFIIMFLFLKDVRSPLLVGITIPTSLVISLLFFYLAGLSLNIVSLSGLILGIGMMIDNSIIVIDNITQFRERGHHLDEACILGVNEVFRPLLSAVLTTCAVFIPLIFIGGISGALFHDQAVAVTIGLFVSLAVSVTLLPVYYHIAYIRGKAGRYVRWLEKINRLDYGMLYEKGFRLVMRNQPWAWLIIFMMLGIGAWLYTSLRKEKMPHLTKNDVLLSIDWNERINIEENNSRVWDALNTINDLIIQNTCLIGEQQFLMSHQSGTTASQAEIYLLASDNRNIEQAINLISEHLQTYYPEAVFRFEDPGNIIELLFGEQQAPLLVHLRATGDFGPLYNPRLQETVNELSSAFPGKNIPPVTWQEQIVLKADPDLLVLYETDQNSVLQALRNAFSENQIMMITGSQTFTPVIIGDQPKTLEEIIRETTVMNKKGKEIRLASFFTTDRDYDLKTIVAGQEGEYYPVPVQADDNEVIPVSEEINRILNQKGFFEAGFTGSYFTSRELIKDLLLILAISLLLLYFILASQFESLILPVIVLLEVPVDIFGAFLFLKIFGASINLMSMIGIVVMSGIIINDSILKVDTVNRMVMSGTPVLKALITGGKRRLKPIVMTSLTTILALLPFLFMKGFGSDLQKPLALAVIGGMIIGTMVSLYFIPLCYYYLKRKRNNVRN